MLHLQVNLTTCCSKYRRKNFGNQLANIKSHQLEIMIYRILSVNKCLTAQHMRELLINKLNSSMDTVLRYGLIMRNMWVNGRMGRQKAKEHSIIPTAIFSKENLSKTRQMVMEHTNIRVVKHMKEAGSTIYKKVKVPRYCKMEAYMKVNSTMG